MSEYPNLNKRLNIKSINAKTMSLEDGSKWQFLPNMAPPESWGSGDEVVVEKIEGKFQSNVLHRVINKTKKNQDRSAVYQGGGISKSQIIDINKSLKAYPDERLDRELEIEKLLDDGCILLSDQSVWQLSGIASKRTGDWTAGQSVKISKGTSILKTYNVKNLDINKTMLGNFVGFQG